MDECKSKEMKIYLLYFCFYVQNCVSGAGVAAMAGSKNTLANIRKRLSFQTIGPDKVNQLRHLRFKKT